MISDAVKNYLLVAKPGIIFGNLITAAGGFFLAARGQIDTVVLLTILIGIALVVACGCVFNNLIDRNLDRKMIRTRNRVLARGLISPKIAVCYALLLGTAGTALIRAAANMLSVAIVLAGLMIYVVVYSLYLKRKSVYGTLIGSLAGAAPPLAGYCAVSGRFDLEALILLSIFSLWQMPHCYAIAIFRSDDYTAAEIPVLPVKQGVAAAKKYMFGYILVFTAAALMPTFAGYTGYRYLAIAAALGLCWLYLAWSGGRRSDDRLWAKKLFVFSLVAIFVLSVMMSIDCSLPPEATILLTYTH
jgi:protoheme IX farnesyltransferase